MRICNRSGLPSAVQSDFVRRPIGFRPPPNRVAFGVRSDGVRRTMTFGYIFKAYIRITMIVIRNKSSKFVLVDLKPSCFHVIIVS